MGGGEEGTYLSPKIRRFSELALSVAAKNSSISASGGIVTAAATSVADLLDFLFLAVDSRSPDSTRSSLDGVVSLLKI